MCEIVYSCPVGLSWEVDVRFGVEEYGKDKR